MSLKSRFFLIPCAAFVLAFSVTVQGFAQDSRLLLFEGGKIDGKFLLRSSLLNGPGSIGAMYGWTSPAFADPFIMFGNPAALGILNSTQIGLSFSPQAELPVEKLSDPAPTVKEEVDAATESFDKRSAQMQYPKLTGIAGRAGSPIGGLGMVFPVGGSGSWPFGMPRLLDRFALGFHQPLYLNIGMVYTGLRTRIRTIDDSPENEILLYAAIKFNADLELTSNSWILAGARQLGPVWLGAGFSRTEVNLKVSGHQRTDGIMSKSENESAFNDPRDPWDNDFFGRAVVDVNGSGWAPRLGLLYRPVSRLQVGADLRMGSEFEMTGPVEFALHRFLPLRLNAPEGEKQFDVNLIEDVSELTKTTSKNYVANDMITASIPGQVSIAVTYLGPVKPSVTFTKYFGEMSYALEMTEDGAPFTYKRGFKPNFAAGLTLDFNAIQLAGGVTQLQDVVSGYKDASGVPIKQGEAVMMPRLSIGFYTMLEDNLALNVLLFGMPEDALKFSLTYTI